MDAKTKADRIERHGYMLACLKMAGTYVRYVEAELGLYRQTRGNQEIKFDFQPLQEQIAALAKEHKRKLEHARDVQVESKPVQADVMPVVRAKVETKGTKEWPRSQKEKVRELKASKAAAKLQKPPKSKRKLLKRKLA